jgi:hypothetical protein
MPAPSTLSGYFYFENAAAKITREQAGYIRLQMQPGQQTTADIRTMFEQSLLATRISGFNKLLFDHRLAAPFVEEAKEWFEHLFLPLMATDLAARRIAVTLAYDVFARLSMVPLSAGVYRYGNLVRSFESEGEALAWLLNDMPLHPHR